MINARDAIGAKNMDLYDDLDFALLESVAAVEPSAKEAPEYKQLRTECKEKESKITELSEKVQKLEAQNKILRKNISCLFKTAKAEVHRKDSIIQEQRDKVARLEAKQATKDRDCGYLGNMMMSPAPSITENEMAQLYLLQMYHHQQQKQLYGSGYTGYPTTGVGQECVVDAVRYNSSLEGSPGSLSTRKRSASEESEWPRRPLLEKQVAALGAEQQTFRKKSNLHRDRHRSVRRKSNEER